MIYLKGPNIYLKLSLYFPSYIHLHYLDYGNPYIICDRKRIFSLHRIEYCSDFLEVSIATLA